MWEIYDDLIAAVPEDSMVTDCLAGLSWFLVRSEGVGAAMRPLECAGPLRNAGQIAGMRTRELAGWIKSWNLYEAAMGLAAINSVFNSQEAVQNNSSLRLEDPDQDVFAYLEDSLRDKKVAVIGHFRNLEALSEICSLSILERIPQPGDYPDPACEYILPEQDVVVMTATTLINKTFPRLLQLSRNAKVVVAGPSTPLGPVLLELGVDILAGLLIQDGHNVWRAVQEGGQHEIFQHGSRMVKVFPAHACVGE